jgi:predicted regulator of Ras-like GTPase activity (Roadblock/LC7/MglB family)
VFEDIFTKFHDKNREIKVIGVWGKDGLELEKKYFSVAEGIDLDFTGAELADVISKIEGIKIAPHNYVVKLNFNDYLIVVFSLTPDFFLVAVTDKNIILGKLNFYLNLYKNKLISIL